MYPRNNRYISRPTIPYVFACSGLVTIDVHGYLTCPHDLISLKALDGCIYMLQGLLRGFTDGRTYFI